MSCLRWALVLLAGAAVAILPSAATGHSGPVLRGFGTAVIDGAPGPGEWDSAARVEFGANRAPVEGGGTVPGAAPLTATIGSARVAAAEGWSVSAMPLAPGLAAAAPRAGSARRRIR